MLRNLRPPRARIPPAVRQNAPKRGRKWDRFALTDAQVIDFMRDLWPADAFLPNRDSTLACLERCYAAGGRPDRAALTATLLPWYLDD